MTETNWQTDNTLCDLSHLGLLSLSGDDATTFLQGQVTNDVAQLNGNNAHYSAYCSPKGRMLALFLAFSHQDKLYLQFSQPLIAPIMKRLKMFVMRSKVDINDVSNDMMRFGVNGPNATDFVTKALGKVPKEDYALVAMTNDSKPYGAIIKLPNIKGHSRYEIIVDATQAPTTWDALNIDCTPVGQPCWDWLDIQTGCPDVLEKTQEQFVPQMLNLDVLNGINFKKGCYTGQEIVARTHYLGKVKRRTYLATIKTAKEITVQPTEGDKVQDATGSEVGQIVKVAPNLDNGFDALIEIRIEAKEAGNVLWNSAPITFGELPYTITTEGQ
ncbi:MAG: YgfZ/GcvT domain-containing protein [Methylophilaceae bacterium]